MLSRAVLLGMTLSALAAQAHDVQYQNASQTQPIAAIRLCSLNAADIESCEDVATSCGPGEVCLTQIDIEPGTHEVYARAAPEGGEWSDESNRITVTIPEPEPDDCLAVIECRADFNGDGAITASDFAIFLRVYGSSIWGQ